MLGFVLQITAFPLVSVMSATVSDCRLMMEYWLEMDGYVRKA